ncbi:type VII secretion system-associated protein [Streptomyces xiangluensis]|uniref:Type VII secretion system-associated protein n=1 Tax=Streptomyces xiangluensis TaxID=2665720 RepID=A0ABV8Z850_9ACTN
MSNLSGVRGGRPAEITDEDTESRPDDNSSDAPGVQGGPGAVLKGQEGFREPPEDFVRAAKVAPNHWLSVIDRHWSGDEDEPPPSWASLGRWRSDEQGEIVEWEVNTEYRPSPDAHGWARPVSPADAAVQLVATGYGSEELFALVLADAEVAVCVDEDGGPAVSEASDGTPVVVVFSTSPELDQDRLPPHEVMSVPDLLDRLPEGKEVLFVSSSAPVAQLVTASALRESKAALDRYEAEGGGDEWPEPDTAVGWPVPETDDGLADLIANMPDIATAGGPPDTAESRGHTTDFATDREERA